MIDLSTAKYEPGDEVLMPITLWGTDIKEMCKFRIISKPGILEKLPCVAYEAERLNGKDSYHPDGIWTIPEICIIGLVGPKSKITPMDTEGLL